MSAGQKFPFNEALSEVLTRKTDDVSAIAGKLLPAHVVAVSGQIVTIEFDVFPEPGVVYPPVTIPVATFPYIRYPIQVGDKGVTLCADVSIAYQADMGGGLPRRAQMPSLAALYFMPLASVNFSEVDPNKITLYGPDGAILRTEDYSSSVVVDPTSVKAKAPERIDLEAANIYLKGIIHLNGPIVQDADQIPGDTSASLLGPVNVTDTVDAADFGTPSVASFNLHDHDVRNVMIGMGTRTSQPPNPGSAREAANDEENEP